MLIFNNLITYGIRFVISLLQESNINCINLLVIHFHLPINKR